MSAPLEAEALLRWMSEHDGVDIRDTAWSTSAVQRILG
jgi:hypothetical protein